MLRDEREPTVRELDDFFEYVTRMEGHVGALIFDAQLGLALKSWRLPQAEDAWLVAQASELCARCESLAQLSRSPFEGMVCQSRDRSVLVMRMEGLRHVFVLALWPRASCPAGRAWVLLERMRTSWRGAQAR